MKKPLAEKFYNSCVGTKSTLKNIFDAYSGANYMRRNGVDLQGNSYQLSGMAMSRMVSNVFFGFMGPMFGTLYLTEGLTNPGLTLIATSLAINTAAQWTTAAFVVGKHSHEQRQRGGGDDLPQNGPDPKYRP